jgi:hypothetical protein
MEGGLQRGGAMGLLYAAGGSLYVAAVREGERERKEKKRKGKGRKEKKNMENFLNLKLFKKKIIYEVGQKLFWYKKIICLILNK